MNILFFGDDEWAARALDRLARDGHALCGVVVRVAPGNGALTEAATRLGVPVLQPTDVNASAFVESVKRLAPDMIVSVSYDQIFGPAVLQIPGKGAINVHNGLLPNYRGGGGLYGAVINGETTFGQTAHLITAVVDGGPIVVQRELPIRPDDTMAELLARATDSMPDTVSQAVRAVETGAAAVRPQPMEGSYFPRKPPGDELIDWSEPSRLLLDRIRARRPGPGNVTFLGRRRIVVWKASATNYPAYEGPVGQVLARRSDGVVVKTGDSAITLHEVQIDGGETIVPRFGVGATFLSNWRHAYLEMRSELDRMAARVQELELAFSNMSVKSTP
jgi:methionyl-tRNA formyltransferase